MAQVELHLSSKDKEQPNLSTPRGAWIAVKKTRRSKTYRVTNHGEIEAVALLI